MISLADLEPERGSILRRVLSSILHSESVTQVFAQVIDGLPTEATAEMSTSVRPDIRARGQPSHHAVMLSTTFAILMTLKTHSVLTQLSVFAFRESSSGSLTLNRSLSCTKASTCHHRLSTCAS
jgi:hypothetical protein